jgi:metal-dependent amidase/aminoacylase/carboxypeptidase family protein
MENLASHAEQLVDSLSGQTDIQATIRWSDQFSTCSNTPLGAQLVEQACRSTGNQCTVIETPYRWSEDFGKLLESAKEGAMFTLGAGLTSPQLHKPDYDFNDELIEQGRNLFIEIIRQTNGLAE